MADVRDKIAIGVRYGCHTSTLKRCQRVLASPDEVPSRVVAALLALCVLETDGESVDAWINHCLEDQRTSHVWRSMVPPKSTRRTQVRDVALALRWHRLGVDPRAKGFVTLEADPLFVFRPYSLGFESDEEREACLALAAEL